MKRPIINAAGEALDGTSVREFERGLSGRMLCPGDSGYDAARSVWNAAIDRRPAVITRCDGVSDVVDALNFARDNRLEIAVRGGGHSAAGNAVCDGGMVIDLSGMKAVHVDATDRTVRAEAGCTWAELDRVTQAAGMATPGGVVSSTGIAGLTLGGGVGWLSRLRGLTCDNLLSVDMVLADGQRLTVDPEQSPELFWGLRGGGGNFGIATSFEYRLHDQGPVLGGMLIHPRSRASELLRFHREFMADAPWELTAYAALRTSPTGEPVVALILCYCGDPDRGQEVLRPLREFGPPLDDRVRVLPYVQMQALLDPAFPDGHHNLWKSGFLDELPDEAIDALIRQAAEGASPLTGVVLEYYGGRVSLFDEDATAFPHRRARYNLVIRTQWIDPAESERQGAWTRDLWQAMKPFSSGDAYFNYLHEEGEAGLTAAFGPNLDRLRALKRRYDAANLFHLNHNIRP